ncbi:hypothetical protein NIES4102_39260 [Chondrocystis sp. NIES-4102]|nr:hypothetical protein NIES4102_39260 [Chondrocystis sp. NIES-4102]
MAQTYSVRCPNCGNLAIRSYFIEQEIEYNNCPENQMTQTECPSCDYLMLTCSINGKLIETYDSSTSALTREDKILRTPATVATQVMSHPAWTTQLSA